MANLPFDLVPRAELEHEPRFASTLANGLDILRCFSAAQPTLGNKEISEALGLSRPTVARLTFTLVTLGYLRRDDASKRYSLAPGVLSLIYPLLLQLTVRRVAEHDLAALSEKAGGRFPSVRATGCKWSTWTPSTIAAITALSRTSARRAPCCIRPWAARCSIPSMPPNASC